MSVPHIPVLLEECLEVFASVALHIFADGTVGAGGHAAALLQSHPEIEVYHAFDQDQAALQIAKNRLASPKVHFHHANFSQMGSVLKPGSADGILVDLGVSSMQFDTPERGFSFQKEGPLDMRMDPTQSLTAYDIVNIWSEEELGQIFRDLGEERFWRRAARAVCRERPLRTTTELRHTLAKVLGSKKEKIDPATRIFQALRIAVNKELEHLSTFLHFAIDLLKPQGRLVVISFHSLEDRIVKQAFQNAASDKLSTSGKKGLFLDKDPTVKLITKKPIVGTVEEIRANPRSRSAKMRAVEKL